MPDTPTITHPHAPVWKAVRDLAQTWTRTKTVSRMTAQLPDNAPDQRGTDAATVASLLQGLRAGYGGLFNRPLFLGTVIPFLLEQPFGTPPGPRVSDTTYSQWLDAARATEQAHRMTIAWLRSRLPGYPILRAPQLARGTNHTTEYFTTNITWTRDELRAGLQFKGAPPAIPQLLQATNEQSQTLYSQAQQLATALQQTPEWEAFTTAQRQLTPTDKEALQNTKNQIARRIADTDHEPGNLYDEDIRRRHHTQLAISDLPDISRTYVHAFDTINALIERTSGDVFGQLVAHGDPTTITSTKIDIHRPGTIHLVVDNSWDHHPGNLLRIDDPLFPDTLEVIGASDTFDILNLRPSTLTLRTIDGTSTWFAGS